MSLPLLAVLVVGGIAAIIAAIHFSGGTKVARLEDVAAAQARFAVDFPAPVVQVVHLTTSGSDAFLELDDGRVGLVHGVGDRFLTRVLGARDVASCRISGERAILLRLVDFTYGGGRFEFETAASAARIAALLTGDRQGTSEAA